MKTALTLLFCSLLPIFPTCTQPVITNLVWRPVTGESNLIYSDRTASAYREYPPTNFATVYSPVVGIGAARSVAFDFTTRTAKVYRVEAAEALPPSLGVWWLASTQYVGTGSNAHFEMGMLPERLFLRVREQ